MNKVERAVILAAGYGNRMKPVTLETPKPLVKVNGIRMIDTAIEALHYNGIYEIYVVVGYLKEQFYEWKKEYPEIRKKYREPAEGLRLRSVTVSMEPSGKYFASLLYEGYSCENQAAGPDYSTAKILGIDYAMQGMAVFSEKVETEEAGFFRKNEKRLAREQRKLSRCVRGSHNYELQKKKVARCHEKIRNQRRDYLHKLSRKIADGYDAVAVEDIDMKAMGQCLHFGKSVHDNGYGMFREMIDYKLAWRGKKMVKVDRFFPSSKKCCQCGRIKKELKLSERVYHCVCGNEMDRDRNAAINIREEARRMLTA